MSDNYLDTATAGSRWATPREAIHHYLDRQPSFSYEEQDMHVQGLTATRAWVRVTGYEDLSDPSDPSSFGSVPHAIVLTLGVLTGTVTNDKQEHLTNARAKAIMRGRAILDLYAGRHPDDDAQDAITDVLEAIQFAGQDDAGTDALQAATASWNLDHGRAS